MELVFSVYCHTNKINGKKYIGITCQDVMSRWRKGKGYLNDNNQPVFARAILKYGWENFEHEILFENLTENEAKEKEIELIAYYHTYVNDPECYGYNMTRGGDGRLLYTTVEEHIEARQLSIKKQNEKLRANKIKHDQYKQYMHKYYIEHKEDQAEVRKRLRKQAYERLKADPAALSKKREQSRIRKANARLDPVIRETERTRARQWQELVKKLRVKLLELAKKYPNVLDAEALYNLKAANRCRNLTYLNTLYKQFEEYIEDGKNNEGK